MDPNKKKTEPEKEEEEKKEEAEKSEESAENGASKESTEKSTQGESEKTEESEKSDDNQSAENGEGAEKSAEKSENEKSEPEKQPESKSQSGESDLQAQLLSAQAQLAAFKCGVRPEAVEDAVCLAINDAKKQGEVTTESIAEALSGVLNRHPDWKTYYEPSNDFRIGADGMAKANSSIDEISKIFGNKEE